ncbi:MAG: B12-binding domain-containing protein, partial [Thermodesulfobacteriota bacterium]
MVETQAFYKALMAGDRDGLIALVNQELEAGTPAADVLYNGLIPSMDVIGEQMESGDV